MVDFNQALQDFVRGAACGFFTGVSDTSDYWRGIRLRRGSVSIPVGAIGADAAAGLQSAICPMNVPPGGFPRVPDGGTSGDGVFGDGTGECMTTYLVTVAALCQYTQGVSSTPSYQYTTTYQSNMPGPLSNIGFRIPGLLVGGIANNTGPPGEFQSGGGSFFGMTVIGVDNTDNKGQGSNQLIGPVSFVSAVRTDGMPDDCGTPSTPGSSGPPTDGTQTNGDLIYDDDSGGTVTQPVTGLVCPPVVGPNGDVYVPVQVDTDEFSLKAYINGSTGSISLFLPEVGDTGCCEVPEMPDSDPPENDEPDPPDNGEPTIIGVNVIVDTLPADIRATQRGGPTVADSFFPDLGTVSFGKKVGSVTSWSAPIRVQKRRQYVECPFSSGAIAVQGIPSPEVTWTLVPDRAILEP